MSDFFSTADVAVRYQCDLIKGWRRRRQRRGGSGVRVLLLTLLLMLQQPFRHQLVQRNQLHSAFFVFVIGGIISIVAAVG